MIFNATVEDHQLRGRTEGSGAANWNNQDEDARGTDGHKSWQTLVSGGLVDFVLGELWGLLIIIIIDWRMAAEMEWRIGS
jgi:hypothetical protein